MTTRALPRVEGRWLMLVAMICATVWLLLDAIGARAETARSMMRAEDVLEVDGSHVRRIYDPAHGVACYLVRWPAANAPDLACVRVEP